MNIVVYLRTAFMICYCQYGVVFTQLNGALTFTSAQAI